MNTSLLKIKRSSFESFDDKTLAWTCIEPIIEKIRGKNLSLKSHVYAQLTTGQQSLLYFWIVYGHAQHGILHFFKEVDYILSDTNSWNEMRNAFSHLGTNDLLNLIEKIENAYDFYIPNKDNFSSDFLLLIKNLDNAYSKIIPNALKQISNYIRNNPNEFVSFTNEK